MTQTARMYGGSLYELAVEEQLVEAIGGQMEEIRQIFHENADYMKLLSEPSIPWEERTKLIDEAFGSQAQKYLVNFIKLLCERNILREYGSCCEEFRRRYNADHGIAEAVVTGAVALNDSQMEALKQKLEKISGKKSIFTSEERSFCSCGTSRGAGRKASGWHSPEPFVRSFQKT